VCDEVFAKAFGAHLGKFHLGNDLEPQLTDGTRAKIKFLPQKDFYNYGEL